MNCEKTKKSNTISMTNTEMITKIMEKIQYFSKGENMLSKVMCKYTR